MPLPIAALLRILRLPAAAALSVAAMLAVQPEPRADTLELSAIASNANGGGFSMDGVAGFATTGRSVSLVGDLNGDNLEDFVVGAPLINSNGTFSGTTYVVFGKANGAAVNLENIQYGIGGFVIHGAAAYDQAGHSVAGAGDVNGDNLDDIIIGAPNASPNGQYSGAAYVVFGKADGTAVDLADVAGGTGGFVMNGITSGERAASAVSGAGDVNGDGMNDILVGVYKRAVNGAYSGAAYVVFGKDDGDPIELSALTGANALGFQILGASEGDRAGYSVSGAGDVDGDGLDDVIIGAPYDGTGGLNGGAAYVVFGKETTETLDLGILLTGASPAGFVIVAETAGVRTGRSVSGAGDVNGDGLADLIVGAPFAEGGGYGSGISYVVFGKSGGAAIDLEKIASGEGGFAILGEAAADQASTVSGAGDVNGDGLADVIIGAPQASPNSAYCGKAYLVFGKPTGSAINLADVAAADSPFGFAVNGIDSSDNAGTSVSNAGDVNGDGLPDIVLGAPTARRNDLNTAGAAYVVFARPADRTVWTDFAHAGVENGKYHTPFNTLAEAVAAVPSGATVKIKGDSADTSSSEATTIVKPVTIHAIGGKIRIGAP